ncbi:prolyl aminopeptidase [Streptomyces tsukubensis]|uniref:Proline iminopeptidase n=1 Tax=Streptomyces tsukubensis TaxID=83656 RepID=A0A1V4A3P5_9ACTN|nr:prolyl aminopeptidase [Streptomyces tsukubensis]OON74683.1 prolyl aminopeptidase [Streptomyces tsukubensis]QFR93044.1 prolyl aminopeptidase [Streptomyces tsukubensis]
MPSSALYPQIEPYDHGMLDVGDGNSVYWEVCGNPEGKPAVVLHGGPGSGCTPFPRRYFDPAAYRIVLLDQRGCGRSTPHASDPATDMGVNTTSHLITDLELLRRRLGIGRWLVWGASWGSVLGLRYAQLHPDRVSELVLTGLATGSRAEVALLTRGLGRFFPEAFARFSEGVPERERAGQLSAAYRTLLDSPDPEVRARAARNWTDWETAIIPAPPRSEPRYEDARFRAAFARIVTHYFSQDHFLGGDEVVLEDAASLNGIPGTIVQGSLDFGNLLGIAWRLTGVWRDGELVLVEDAGHNAGTPTVVEQIVAATDRYAARDGAGR